MHPFQHKISGGHETEMGRLRENMVYSELPSHVLWERRILELLCSFSGLAWQLKHFHSAVLRNCHFTGKLQCYYVLKHISRTSIISGLFTRDECCFLSIFTEATITVNRILHNRGYQIFP